MSRSEAHGSDRCGFTYELVFTPFLAGTAVAQVPAFEINAAFTPTADEVAEARAIVAPFAADPTLGTIGRKGAMLDRPHLARAQALLARAPA